MMSDVLVSPFFEEQKEVLRSRLTAASGGKSQQEVCRIVGKFLEDALGPNGVVAQKLPDPQRFLVESVLAFTSARSELPGHPTPAGRREQATWLQREPSEFSVRELARDGIISFASALLAADLLTLGSTFGVAVGVGVLEGMALGILIKHAPELLKSFPEIQAHITRSPYRHITSESDRKYDPERVIDAIARACRCMDDLLKTYRAQLANAAHREEQAFESGNGLLLSQIQFILGSPYKANPGDREDVLDLVDECLQLERQLQNKGLRVVRYTGNDDPTEKRFFHFSSLAGIDTPEMELPAIVRGNTTILAGRVNVPST